MITACRCHYFLLLLPAAAGVRSVSRCAVLPEIVMSQALVHVCVSYPVFLQRFTFTIFIMRTTGCFAALLSTAAAFTGPAGLRSSNFDQRYSAFGTVCCSRVTQMQQQPFLPLLPPRPSPTGAQTPGLSLHACLLHLPVPAPQVCEQRCREARQFIVHGIQRRPHWQGVWCVLHRAGATVKGCRRGCEPAHASNSALQCNHALCCSLLLHTHSNSGCVCGGRCRLHRLWLGHLQGSGGGRRHRHRGHLATSAGHLPEVPAEGSL
jgi:hypothetical protein